MREVRVWAPVELLPAGSCESLLGHTTATLAHLRDDILASLPQMLGFVHHDVASGISHLDCSNGCSPMAASGPYFVLWHLYLAGSLPLNSTETHAWVIDRLFAIREIAGIQKAAYLAAHLQTGPLFSEQNVCTMMTVFV